MKTLFLSTAVAAALLTAATGPAWADPCQTIAGASVPNTVITATQSVPAGTYQAPNGQSFAGMPAFCRVVASVSTLPGEHVGIEVWLPTGWNGRFEGLGNGGFGGSIVYSALAAAVQQGYAAANTDTGHTGGS